MSSSTNMLAQEHMETEDDEQMVYPPDFRQPKNKLAARVLEREHQNLGVKIRDKKWVPYNSTKRPLYDQFGLKGFDSMFTLY
jgi:hypothetical protein